MTVAGVLIKNGKPMIEIIYPQKKYFKSFHEALDTVARERVYIEMIEAPPFQKVFGFQEQLVASNGAVHYAVHEERVVGWCDIFPSDNPRQAHRGGLGMGIVPGFRGQGLGSRLLAKTLEHASRSEMEKVELHVYTSNTAAIALYRKFGFEEEGLIKKYRKLDGRYFDCLAMAKWLRE